METAGRPPGLQGLHEEFAAWRGQMDGYWSEFGERFDQRWPVLSRALRCSALSEQCLARYLRAAHPAIAWTEGDLHWAALIRVAADGGLLSHLAPSLHCLDDARRVLVRDPDRNLADLPIAPCRDWVRAWHRTIGEPAPEDALDVLEAYTRSSCAMLGAYAQSIEQLAGEAGLVGYRALARRASKD